MNQRRQGCNQNARPISISVYHVVVNEPQSQAPSPKRNPGQKKYNPNTNNAGTLPRGNSYNQRPQNNHNSNSNFNSGNIGTSTNKNYNISNGHKTFNQGQRQYEATNGPNGNAFTRSNSCRPQNNFAGNNVRFYNNFGDAPRSNSTSQNVEDRNLRSNFNSGGAGYNQSNPGKAFIGSNSYKPQPQNNFNAQNISVNNFAKGNSAGKAFTRSNSCNIGAGNNKGFSNDFNKNPCPVNNGNGKNWKPKPKTGTKNRNTSNINNITIVMDHDSANSHRNHTGAEETSTPDRKEPEQVQKNQLPQSTSLLEVAASTLFKYFKP